MESRTKRKHEREAARHCHTQHKHEYYRRLTVGSRKKMRHEGKAAHHAMRNINIS